MTFDPKPYFIEMGKDKKGNPKLYLQVAHRIMWFRDEHPDWTLKTYIVQLDPCPVMCCEVIDSEGRLIATGHGMAAATGGKLWSGREVEKAETAAQGRALAAAGFGTQFAEDYEDDEYPSDSPVAPAKKTAAKKAESDTKGMSRETFIAELGKRNIKGDDDAIKAVLEDYDVLRFKGDYDRMLLELDKVLNHVAKVRQQRATGQDTVDSYGDPEWEAEDAARNGAAD